MELGGRGTDICAQAADAFGKKGNLDHFWQTTAENHYPERANFTVTRSIGEDITSGLYSAEPILFRRDFGNFIGSTIRPEDREWFTPRVRNDTINNLQAVRSYLEPRARTMRSLLYDRRSQFSRAMTMADHDWAAFGNAVTSVEIRDDKSGLRFRNWHLRDCAWRENFDGEVDTMYRRLKVKVRAMCAKSRAQVNRWDICPKVTERLEKNPDEDVNVLHVEMPVWDYDLTRKRRLYPEGWISLYVDEDNKWQMSEKNIRSFDYAVDRWFLISGSPYAFSPCVVCSMPDAQTLQTMTWSIVEAGEKAVEPPLVATQEAVLGGVNITAGGITWVDKAYDEKTGEALRALDLGGNPQFGEVLRQQITANLNSAWYLNKLFLPQNNVAMTAEETARRWDEYLQVAQPVIAPAESERNGNMLEISIPKAIDMGAWGPITDMPRELQGQHVDYSYDNPLQDARKRAKTMAYKEAAGVIEISSKITPHAIAHFEGEKAFRDAISGIAPPDWLKSEDEGYKAAKEMDTANTMGQAAGELSALTESHAKSQQALAGAQAQQALPAPQLKLPAPQAQAA